jgi:hypothetical protein
MFGKRQMYSESQNRPNTKKKIIGVRNKKIKKGFIRRVYNVF